MIHDTQATGAKVVSTRKDAIAVNAPRYFTGKPCKRGHTEYRRTDSGKCIQCDRDHATRQRVAIKNDPVALQKRRSTQLAYAKRRLADPETRERIRELEKAAYNRSPSRKANKAAADALRNAREENKARRRKNVMARYYWLRENNPPAFSRMQDQRKVMLRFATPTWVQKLYADQMRDIYWSAARRTRETGIEHHVDHIIPIRHENVCGLHVPWNLQVITASQNLTKGNSFDPSLGIAQRIDTRCDQQMVDTARVIQQLVAW